MHCGQVSQSGAGSWSFEFVPGSADGDGFGGGGGEENRIRDHSNAAEIQTVRVKADSEGWIGLGFAAVVDIAGRDEKIHAGVVESEMAGLAEGQSEKRAAGAVLGIGVFVFPAGIVKEREETNHFRIRTVDAGEVKAVVADFEPMAWSVVGMGIKSELTGNKLPEGDFRGGEHRVKMVGSSRGAGWTGKSVFSKTVAHGVGQIWGHAKNNFDFLCIRPEPVGRGHAEEENPRTDGQPHQSGFFHYKPLISIKL